MSGLGDEEEAIKSSDRAFENVSVVRVHKIELLEARRVSAPGRSATAGLEGGWERGGVPQA